jgi:hypothetical protein
LVAAAAIVIGLLGGCSDKPSSPGVPRLSGGAAPSASASAGENPNGVTGDGSAERRAKLHAAAECIRQHGVPGYQDPLLTPDGRVYTDARSLQDTADETMMNTIEQQCGELIRAAKFSPEDQAPAPPKLIQAGVKSAECLRSHGLPNVQDPTASTHFTPGHGFGLNGSWLPSGGKEDPTVKGALTACRSILDEEARLSSLGSLADA